MDPLADALARIGWSWSRDRAQLPQAAQHLAKVADQAGLPAVATIARTVSGMARGDDTAALAANVARLAWFGSLGLVEMEEAEDDHEVEVATGC
ncbi:hypothetical protein FEV53_05530 [Palleronia caenipelagi]|uniref:Uncharacterized protein n=1 Tax=Palleronia caenipelagi TaxID=2489174 RepID=A0A547Q732_9RHOB|nr:hypothetical protein FEV53_05530 [Palleronia caenipelagi]